MARRAISLAFGLLVLAIMLTMPHAAFALDAYEPDDTTATAAAVRVDGAWMERVIAPAGDVDRIAIPARARRYYEVTIGTEHRDGLPLVATAFDVDGGVAAGMRVTEGYEWTEAVRASADGTITLVLRHDATHTGPSTGAYRVKVFEYVGARISGTVTNLQGVPVAGATVTADDGLDHKRAVTDDLGRYTISDLRPGTARVDFEAYGYAHQSYPYAPAHESAYRMPPLLGDPVVLEDGEERDGIDAALSRWASVSGRVLDPHGRGAYQVDVGVYWRDREGAWRLFWPFDRWSAPDGAYRFYVPEGTYAIAFRDSARSWPDVFYLDATSADPTPVVVREGESVEGLDQKTPPLATVTGHVVDRRGRPVPGIRVKVFGRVALPNGNGDRWADEHVGTFTTDRRGWFRAGGLGSGEYRLLITDPRGRYPDQWYLRDRADPYTKTVNLVAGRTTNLRMVPVVDASAPALADVPPRAARR